VRSAEDHYPGFEEDRALGLTRPDQRQANTTTLVSVLDDKEFKGKKTVYLWDFGDNWEHVITVTKRGPASDGVEFVSARGHRSKGNWPFEIKVFRGEDKERISRQLAKYKVTEGNSEGSDGDESSGDESSGAGSNGDGSRAIYEEEDDDGSDNEGLGGDISGEDLSDDEDNGDGGG
jgi:hypothetical protein